MYLLTVIELIPYAQQYERLTSNIQSCYSAQRGLFIWLETSFGWSLSHIYHRKNGKAPQ